MEKIRVGLIGIGGMGRVHYNAYLKNPDAEVVAFCDVDPAKRAGQWGKMGLNIGTTEGQAVDLSKMRVYEDYRDLVQDEGVDLVDICLPIDLHAEPTIAALNAGKHVLCEKPMARSSEECRAMEAAAAASGKQLIIAHCLRWWPHYVAAHAEIASGQYGKPICARFHRAGGTPKWSYQDWLRQAPRSGGVVLDMHVHDVDTALWWFGKPESLVADGHFLKDLPSIVDATWRYADGLCVHLHSLWDDNDMPFRYAFTVIMEKGTVLFDSGNGKPVRVVTEGGVTKELPLDGSSAYENEINEIVARLKAGEIVDRVTTEGSRLAVEMVEEEMRQIYERNGRTL